MYVEIIVDFKYQELIVKQIQIYVGVEVSYEYFKVIDQINFKDLENCECYFNISDLK